MNSDKKVLRVVGCIIEHSGRILMLHRSKVETDPSLWGIPAGKVEPGESDLEAIVREVQEETGITLGKDALEYKSELPIEYPETTVVFPVFKVVLATMPDITLSPREHVDFGWFVPSDVLKMPDLMRDVDIIIDTFAA